MRVKLLLLFCAFGCLTRLNSQIDVQITINSGVATTTCTDLFSGPDPLWEVNINNAGWETYPQEGACFNSLPNLQYTASYACPTDVPAQVTVCFRAFENDGLFPVFCQIDAACSETICQDFAIPVPGTSISHTLALAPGLSSGGEVSFTINTLNQGAATNDLLCNAIDLGVVTFGDTIGNASQGGFGNYCATNAGEPDPASQGYFFNEAGVWFRFQTGPNPGTLLIVDVLSDPEATGDPIELQAAAYLSANETCTGAMTLLTESAFLDYVPGNDLQFRLACPQANRTYFILVDGNGMNDPALLQGVFGIEVSSLEVQEGGNLRCQFEDLGQVPANGSVGTNGLRSNYCATASGDPFVAAFISQHSVWFRFVAPPSGHVVVQGISDTATDPLGIQIAVYRSLNNSCNGFFSHVGSIYTDTELDESLELTCLFPGTPYWILIDGSGDQPKGLFSLNVYDAGDITPVTMLDTMLCAGQSLQVGNSIYSTSGVYNDTLQVFAGCDSIIISNITVMPPIDVVVTQTVPAIGEGNNNGVATVSATGGSGNFTFAWCSGETGSQAMALTGGANCCVTVTDGTGCEVLTCFEVDFTTQIIPSITNDTVACHGNTNGELVFSAINGFPPYQYTWQNQNNTINGSGTIQAAGDEITVPNLPAGTYTFTVFDAFYDTTFTAQVIEPEPLVIDILNITDASCFGFCDGALQVQTTGGTGAYQLSWSGGLPAVPNPGQLCAGNYRLTVTDANACMSTLEVNVGQPAEFIANAALLNPVSCFGGSDGRVTVITNGAPQQFQWSSGQNTATVVNLPSGFYDVTVVNSDGCEDYSSIQVPQPNQPLVASIEVAKPISCFGASDGTLLAMVTGDALALQYNWSNGAAAQSATGLAAGPYSVTATNEKGCTATTTFTFSEPSDILASLSVKNINCLDGPSDGAIFIDAVSGGTPAYRFSVDGVVFTNLPELRNLPPATYEVIISDAAGCEKSYPATIMGPPELNVTLGEDLLIPLGASAELTALSNSLNLTYAWTPGDTSGINNTPSIVATPLESTLYTVQVTDTVTFCKATDNLFITISKERNVFIPNAITPNADGINDGLMVFGGLGVARVKSFRVFTRTGSLVFEELDFQPNDPAYAWFGNFKGQPLNTGVYVYMAEIEFLDGLTEVFKGDVSLLRKD
ncbi:MAG: gliding motility-associated C-terminal domain-containing protein [Saprospiraceae bacterium]|nr:gliding motility-associated C-terminal domain-containing protein [Saprospiraceae bacterium]